MTSKIGWTDETWNPITGCTPCSPGCENCYAAMMSRRLKGRFGYHYQDPFQVTLHKVKFKQPLQFKKPKKIFTCSMGDLFHPDVPDQWIDAVLQITTLAPQHSYQILTKRPERMKKYLSNIVCKYKEKIPSNLWFGVTAENQQMADHRIPLLVETPVANRFISIEPMIEAVDISSYIDQIDWVITGGETGIKARYMDPAWAKAVMMLCREHQVPFFFKQMTKKAAIPQDLMVKQFPQNDAVTY